MLQWRKREISAQGFTQWLAEFPNLYIYLKMHSAKRGLNDRLCGLTAGRAIRYSYETVEYKDEQLDVPIPLLRLPEWGFPMDRLGFDWMITEQNADEVPELVGPWSQSFGLAFYCEPLMPLSGRMPANAKEYVPTAEQLEALRQAGFMVREDCTVNKLIGKIVVSGRGYVFPIIAFTHDQFANRPSLVYDPEKGFMDQRDNHPLFQRLRYEAGCPCAMGNQNLGALLDKYAPREK